MSVEIVTQLMETYGRAWITQDPDLILTIFTDDATYHEPREPKCEGKEAIRTYWASKVGKGQKDISFELKHVWVAGETGVVAWHADFIDTVRTVRIAMDGTGIFKLRDGKFCDLRENNINSKSAITA